MPQAARNLSKPKIVTIGVYGSTEASFFNALIEARVDTFCDIRARRGLRGSLYSFANSAYLQRKLQTLNIRYLHFKDLAPSNATRQLQGEADAAKHVARRKRTQLDSAFIKAYEADVLAHFEPQRFLEQVGETGRIICLFCVERDPAACHRSLLAERLASFGCNVAHLLP